ncbi:MAG: PP5 family serine/threonine-protein phosphatase [archaeon]|nr:PP5 family serine/threonine-protein phosphatase [archaeon]
MALEKYHQCAAELRRLAFERAIAVPDTVEVETVNLDNVAVPADYDGPHLTLPITVEQVESVCEAFSRQKLIHRKYVYLILQQCYRYFQKQKSLIRVPVAAQGTIKVFGDVHGQYYDVLNIFKVAGKPSGENPMLFNGDFVDRGAFSCEIILVFLAYKLVLPEAFFLNRGNHEALSMNRMYGFEREVKHKYGERAFEMFLEVFRMLPLAHVLNDRVLVVHGGLFAQDGVTLKDIENIDRNREPPDSGIMCDLLWSDPMDENGRQPSKRGVGVQFGPDVTKRFLDENKLDILVRSHEVRESGYTVEHDGRCITIFSAPNYCDNVGNLGAFITFTGETMTPVFTHFTAVPHPKVSSFAGPLFG